MRSSFEFIRDDHVLRENIERVFGHIIDLLALSESESYDDLAKSSFRKTIVIHTASIIEACLLYLLRNRSSEKDFINEQWGLKNVKDLHIISPTHKIVGGDYKKISEKIDPSKMNLGQIGIFLRNKDLISEELFQKIDAVRILRNEQHIGTNSTLKEYSKTDLEFVFSVAKQTKELFTI